MPEVQRTAQGHWQRTLLKNRQVDDILISFSSFMIVQGKFDMLFSNSSVALIFVFN